VYNTLKETAPATQKRSIAELSRRGVRFKSFFAGNEIYVHGGSEQALNAILALGDAGTIRAPVTVKLEPAAPRFLQSVGPVQTGAELQAETQSIIDWGITELPPPIFGAHSLAGESIIVANIDSGVQYDHPALAAAYRCAGGGLPSAACWYDATNPTITTPYDDNGHGTHTMGTMVGSNNPSLTYTVGMAPEAKWIACKAFGSDGKATDSALESCAQWILAPNNNPSNRPHIVNNSWGGDSANSWFQDEVQAWAAAGIFPVFSAGNSGSASTCNNIYSPADYPESFAIAAHDSSRSIANFSSKGPLTNYYGQSEYLKPEISAPGVYIRSSFPGNSYASYSGTSMAAPHVSGAVALLWSCNPTLVGEIDTTVELLEISAEKSSKLDTCGSPEIGDGNYTFGRGYLNVYQAGWMVCGGVQKAYLPAISKMNDSSLPPDPIINGDFEMGVSSWYEYSQKRIRINK